MSMVIKSATSEELGIALKNGSIAVIPTDTQYGIVTSALNPTSVERVYTLRKRSPEKPMIILISKIQQIQEMGITINPKQTEIMKKWWPNPVSLIIPVASPALKYLHRGKNSLAFRMPKDNWLQSLLEISGPLIAPSANWEGEIPATTIEEAKKYFGKEIATYVDNGKLNNPPSTIISLSNTALTVIRQGAFIIH